MTDMTLPACPDAAETSSATSRWVVDDTSGTREPAFARAETAACSIALAPLEYEALALDAAPPSIAALADPNWEVATES